MDRNEENVGLDPRFRRLRRREFTAGICAIFGWAGTTLPIQAADIPLHVLVPGNLDRLRMDFNASLTKVRLLAMLSPT